MYNEYVGKGITPATIVNDLKNSKISEEEAIRQIEYCMYEAVRDEAPMGKEELKRIKEYIADLLLDRYEMKAKGNAECINGSLKDALKRLGQGCDFKKIPRKYYSKLEDILYTIV